MNVSDIENSIRQTGYDHVHFSAPRNAVISKPFQAIVYGGKLDKSGRAWRGTRRATALESAQDYCDYVNGGLVPLSVKLISAGHVRVRSEATLNPLRVEAYRLLAEAALAERDCAGYVYCISDGTALKLGKTSSHPSNRVASLQTGNPRLLKLLGYLEAKNMTEAETALHRKFGHLNVLGEWFSDDPAILTEFGMKAG